MASIFLDNLAEHQRMLEQLGHLDPAVGAAASGKQVKDALARGAVTVNDRAVSAAESVQSEAVLAPERALFGRFYLVRIGKKQHHLFEVAGDG